METKYRTVLKEACDEIIIKKSKFIGYAKPVETEEEAIEFIQLIKKKHRDATHNVPAYVIGENNAIQRCNDDGEPSGTAGVPILEILKKENLRNVVVIVTRYFGGVKLGVGGLVRAYTKGVKAGLEAASIIEKIELYAVKYKIDYSLIGKVEYEIERNKLLVHSKTYDDLVNIILLIEKKEIENMNNLMANWTQGKFDYEVNEENYYNIIDGQVIL